MDASLSVPVRRRIDRQRFQDAAFRGTTQIFAIGVLVLLGAIVAALAAGALPAFRTFGWGFLTSDAWNPVKEHFGGWPAIYCTLVSSAFRSPSASPSFSPSCARRCCAGQSAR